MASYTRYRDLSVQGTGTNGSYAVGKKGSEVAVITSAGTVVTVTTNTIVSVLATITNATITNANITSLTAGTVVGNIATLVTSFATASSAQTTYVITPFAGNITAVYVTPDTAARAAAHSVTHGSAGDVAATGTNTTSIAGVVTSLTLGTVACTAGESLSVLRGVQGTTGGSYVTIVISRTS